MTYFDRDHELSESALSCIYTVFGETFGTLTLTEPFSVELTTGKTAVIVAISHRDSETICFITTDSTIPSARIVPDSLMNLVDQMVLAGRFSRS